MSYASPSRRRPASPAEAPRRHPGPRAAAGAVEPLEGRRLFAAMVFTIDPAQSRVDLGGTVSIFDIPVRPQATGSLSTTYQGTISADIGTDAIHFDGASRIIAGNNGTWEPGIPPTLPPGQPPPPPPPGRELANYGAQAVVPLLGINTKAAFRDMVFNLVGDAPRDPSSDSSFVLPSDGFSISAGRLDYLDPQRGGASPDLSKARRPDTLLSAARYSVANGVATLTLPINVEAKLNLLNPTDLTTTDSTLTFQGTIVATAALPPPVEPPRVMGAWANGQSWAPAFRSSLQSQGLGSAAEGCAIATSGTADELPWTNVDQLRVRFNGDVHVGPDSLLVAGTRLPKYEVSGFAYDPASFTATWTLANPIGLDRVRLSLSGVTDPAGKPLAVDFSPEFNVVPGDADRNGRVDAFDTLSVRARQGGSLTANSTTYAPLLDVDGNGRIDAFDTLGVRAKQGTNLNQVPVPTGTAFGWTAIAASAGSLTGQLEQDQVLA